MTDNHNYVYELDNSYVVVLNNAADKAIKIFLKILWRYAPRINLHNLFIDLVKISQQEDGLGVHHSPEVNEQANILIDLSFNFAFPLKIKKWHLGSTRVHAHPSSPPPSTFSFFLVVIDALPSWLEQTLM